MENLRDLYAAIDRLTQDELKEVLAYVERRLAQLKTSETQDNNPEEFHGEAN